MGANVGVGGRLGEANGKRLLSYPTWEYDLLRNLGGNPTNLPVSLEVLNLWAQHEGVQSKANNWIAVSSPPEYPLTGSNGTLSGNADYIATFPTESAGVNGITEFLRNSTYIGNGKSTGLVAALINPNSTVSDITSQIPSTLWGGDAAFINANANDSQFSNTSQNRNPIYTGGATTGPEGSTAGSGSHGKVGCNSADTLIGGGGLGVHWNILNQCQAKALSGGMIVGLGGVIFAAGMVILFTGLIVRGPVGQAVTSSAGPVGKAVGLFSRSAPKSSAGDAQVSRSEIFEGRTLSSQQSAFRRERGDAALSQAFARQRKAGIVT